MARRWQWAREVPEPPHTSCPSLCCDALGLQDGLRNVEVL